MIIVTEPTVCFAQGTTYGCLRLDCLHCMPRADNHQWAVQRRTTAEPHAIRARLNSRAPWQTIVNPDHPELLRFHTLENAWNFARIRHPTYFRKQMEGGPRLLRVTLAEPFQPNLVTVPTRRLPSKTNVPTSDAWPIHEPDTRTFAERMDDFRADLAERAQRARPKQHDLFSEPTNG